MRLNMLPYLIVALVPAVLIGCREGSGPDAAVVKGEVKYAGRSVEDGMIRFCPIDGTPGPANVAQIRKGRYEITARGGVAVGEHRVEIQAFKETGTEKLFPEGCPQAQSTAPSKKQYLPPKYNSKSVLTATIPPGERKIIRNFDLTE